MLVLFKNSGIAEISQFDSLVAEIKDVTEFNVIMGYVLLAV